MRFTPLLALLPALARAQMSSTTTASAALATPGFVNNGTIGSVQCSGSSNTTVAEGQAVLNATAAPSYAAPSYATCPDALQPSYPFNKIHLRAPDDSLRATFIPFGATLTELWTKARDGSWRDVVLSFDNVTNYATDPIHPNFGPTVGRYANRIKNGTFEIDGVTFNTPLNENNVSTLHGGDVGYDRSSYNISSLNASSVTFSLFDPAGNQGFPGAVTSYVTHSLLAGGVWSIQIDATVAEAKTPLMLSSHVYWNLEAYQESQTVLDHVLHLPLADRYIATDSILIPTGALPPVNGTPYDFQQPTAFRTNFNDTLGICGAGCQGWDSAFVMSSPRANLSVPIIEMWSPKSGIKLSVTSDQSAIQVYSCAGISSAAKGSIPRKRAHGGDGTLDTLYDNTSCVVLEAEDYIDGINNPQWGRDQIHGPDRPYTWRADYAFSTVDEQGNAVAANASATTA